MSQKAQAAMEFIMTYGWAILIILIAIIALAYFGVFTPEYLTERCIPSPGIKCLNHVAESAKVRLNLQNNLEKAIKIKKIELIDEKNCNLASFNITLKNKESSIFIIDCNLVPGNIVASRLKITYDEINGSIALINSGTLNTKVREYE